LILSPPTIRSKAPGPSLAAQPAALTFCVKKTLPAFGGLKPPIFKISIYTPSIILYRLFRIDNFFNKEEVKEISILQ
jgi:hypothetical protein